MDRIWGLLLKLCEAQHYASKYAIEDNADELWKASSDRDALRQQIADEWRAKDAALEAAEHYTAVGEEYYRQADLGQAPREGWEHLGLRDLRKELLKAKSKALDLRYTALARAKGPRAD